MNEIIMPEGNHHPFCAQKYQDAKSEGAIHWSCRCDLLREYDNWSKPSVNGDARVSPTKEEIKEIIDNYLKICGILPQLLSPLKTDVPSEAIFDKISPLKTPSGKLDDIKAILKEEIGCQGCDTYDGRGETPEERFDKSFDEAAKRIVREFSPVDAPKGLKALDNKALIDLWHEHLKEELAPNTYSFIGAICKEFAQPSADELVDALEKVLNQLDDIGSVTIEDMNILRKALANHRKDKP